jgi:UDP-N-acetylglucosamine 2-epimerase (non-hydrolysing)
VLVHGDTTTALAAALSAFYARMKIGHVEAGLRSFDLMSPWPEEMNRSLVDRISDAMFAPTDLSRDNLLQENLPADRIIVTGNTIIDALLDFTKLLQSDVALRQRLERKFSWLHPEKKIILVTGHRRESFGAGFEQICHALQSLSKREDIEIIYPVHLNPQVNGPVYRLLGNRPNLYLIGPQSYLDFVYLMTRSYLILTDSGGVQEEAPSLGKPVLVMRDITERPEAIAAGTVKLVGANAERIERSVAALLDDPTYYATFVHAHNPYGDGRASERIVAFLEASAIRN